MWPERASQRRAYEPEDEDLEALLAAEEEIAGEWAPPRAFDDEPSHDPQDVLFLGMDEDEDALDAMREAEAEEHTPVHDEDVEMAEAPAAPAAPVVPAVPVAPVAPQAVPSTSAIPKYIPAEPIQAVTSDGTPITISRRRRTRGWKVGLFLTQPPVAQPTSSSEFLAEPLQRLMQRAREPLPERPRMRARTASPVMWVEKYRPRKFTELLGDDRVHRDALRWLKEWDPCVFGREGPAARKRFHDDEEERAPDAYRRPHERVLLVSGPPGLGKTTLAHVIAEQAGYRVYELNASDARTAGDVEARVRVALESDSLRGAGKPTMVVIDEIDGATGGEGLGTASFIRALVRLIERGKGDSRRHRGTDVGKKKKAPPPILRPIVCVCNDLYAPALRPLRPFARILRFHRPPTPAIARRLSQICAGEELKADTRSLSLLCELTHGDIRACLHALEMLRSRDVAVNDEAITQSTIGIKDSVVSQQRLFAQLFCAVDATTSSFHAKRTRQAKATLHDRVQALVHEITGHGEYDRLALGCFEHYPHLRLADQGWHRYRDAHDWLHFAQAMTQRAYGAGGSPAYELFAFLPWAFVPFHLLFANLANPLPEQMPRTDYENHLRLTEMHELVATVRTHLPPASLPFYGRQAIATELGPALVRILSPDLKLVRCPTYAAHAAGECRVQGRAECARGYHAFSVVVLCARPH